MIKLPQLQRRKPVDQRDPRRSIYILAVVAACGATVLLQMYWVANNKFRFTPFAIERIRCELCSGVGMISRPDEAGVNRLNLCEACFGIGNHAIRRVDEADVLCPACVGFGRVETGDGGWRWCARCDGRGLIRREGAPLPTYQPRMPVYGSKTPTNAEPPATSGQVETLNIEH
ncbi:MAG TPA: hypothetical protein PKE12_01930 [Kiritimatiellia bacterium]|nr:hypothetical protein [Kiritimatiellia bacterium]